MFGVGQALGEAIVKQNPDKFAETAMSNRYAENRYGRGI